MEVGEVARLGNLAGDLERVRESVRVVAVPLFADEGCSAEMVGRVFAV